MQVFRLDPGKLQSAYNILCQGIFPDYQANIHPPFGMTYCEVIPLGKTAPHDHYDGETFLILSGRGQMRINEENRPVQKGDVVFIPNHSRHELENISTEESLKFVSIYWNEPALSRHMTGDYLIYSAPPTPNGKLHVGHLSGPYFAADVLKRYLRLRGLNTVYCSGADENQTYVPAKARQLKKEPLTVANEFTEQILSILNGFGARPDFFLTPHSDLEFQKYVQDFFTRLVENGALRKEENSYPFCNQCNLFVHESSVSGSCPSCSEKTNGNGCEACGLYNDCRDLKDPHCNICDATCVLKSSTRYVYSLKGMKSRLQEGLKKKHLSPRLKQYTEKLLDQGLIDVTVTYPYAWGVSVPQRQGEVIYEWLEMAAAYAYQAQKATSHRDYAHYWVNPRNKTTLAFGFDNSFFYMALVPALLWSFDERIRYPDVFLTNYFYLLEGKKFSTSRNHAIWGDDILKKVKPDVIRLYLAFTRPEQKETNFTLDEFENFVSETGIKKLDELLGRISRLETGTENNTTALTATQRNYLERWNLLIHEAELAFDPQVFSLNRFSEVLSRYLLFTSQFVIELEKESNVNMRVVLAGLKGLAQLISPVCPEYGGLLFQALHLQPKWSLHLDLHSSQVSLNRLPLTYFQEGFKK